MTREPAATVDSPVESGRLDPDDSRSIRQNSFWNALQQVSNLASGSVFAIVLAWVLPLRDYGVYSYALALCTVGFAVTTAGLNGLGIKYIVAEGVRGTRSVAAILLIREMFCVVTYLVLGAISFTSHDKLTTVASLVALSSLFVRALDAPELWYMANMRSRRTAMIRVITVTVMVVVRVSRHPGAAERLAVHRHLRRPKPPWPVSGSSGGSASIRMRARCRGHPAPRSGRCCVIRAHWRCRRSPIRPTSERPSSSSSR